MAIQVKVGLRRLKTLPTRLSEGHHHDPLLAHGAELGELHGLALQQYTSLKDLISANPGMWGSPKPKMSDMLQIELKDELLKQAARAYLLPVAAETAPEVHFFTRCWKSFVAYQGMATIIISSLLTHLHACIAFFREQPYRRFLDAFSRAFQLLKRKAKHMLSSGCG